MIKEKSMMLYHILLFVNLMQSYFCWHGEMYAVCKLTLNWGEVSRLVYLNVTEDFRTKDVLQVYLLKVNELCKKHQSSTSIVNGFQLNWTSQT